MGSLRIFNQQVRRFAAVGALLFATLVPALVPAMVSAETLTTRSIALSTSAKAAEDVNYKINFKAAQATSAFVIDFCTTAAIGATCTTPADFDVMNDVGATGSETVTRLAANTVKVELGSTAGAGTNVPVELTGITNPSEAGTMYARIVTYTDGTAAAGHTAPDTLGTYLDTGTVALSITDNIGVTGSVLETLLFCASSETIADNCVDGEGGELDPPSVSLGANGILGETASTGTIHSQLSTNAAHGAVVSLKSSAAGCGGLMLAGASGAAACGITPLTTASTTIADSAAKFGLKLGALTGSITPETGYSTSQYYLDYPGNDDSGITSTYGDPIYNTDGDPISNGAADMTFGANISNTTPAGSYAATLSLIATGTF